MASQTVMDHTGDTQYFFDRSDAKALLEAEERFNALVREGYTAAVRDVNGTAKVTRSFDPRAEESLFYPRLVGG
jgi:hypothetical protein